VHGPYAFWQITP
jgi:hypothetical protein